MLFLKDDIGGLLLSFPADPNLSLDPEPILLLKPLSILSLDDDRCLSPDADHGLSRDDDLFLLERRALSWVDSDRLGADDRWLDSGSDGDLLVRLEDGLQEKKCPICEKCY